MRVYMMRVIKLAGAVAVLLFAYRAGVVEGDDQARTELAARLREAEAAALDQGELVTASATLAMAMLSNLPDCLMEIERVIKQPGAQAHCPDTQWGYTLRNAGYTRLGHTFFITDTPRLFPDLQMRKITTDVLLKAAYLDEGTGNAYFNNEAVTLLVLAKSATPEQVMDFIEQGLDTQTFLSGSATLNPKDNVVSTWFYNSAWFTKP